MSFESVSKNLDPVEFAEAFVDSAVTQPWNAIRQLYGQEIDAPAAAPQTVAAHAGQIAGTLVDFVIVSKLTGGAMKSIVTSKSEGLIFDAAARMAVSGAVYSGLFTPSANDRSLLLGRSENALAGAVTFGIMGGVGKALEGRNLIGGSPLFARSFNGALAGGCAGIPAAFGAALISENRAPSVDEVVNSVGHFAVFGAGFGAVEHGLHRFSTSDRVNSYYLRAKWALADGKVEAKRLSYSVLNRYNMRHPLQRAGDLIYGTELPQEAAVPALTEANNPANIFEQRLPEYLREKAQFENDYDFGKSHRDLRAVNEDFAHELLKLWHGTRESPGLSQLTDAEVAQHGVPVARVAQIRQALSSSTVRSYPELSPFERALEQLAPEDLPCNFKRSSPTEGFAGAKERFYGYDEAAIGKLMRMPTPLHYTDHGYGTPPSWTPFEPTAELPNYFHGTVSRSLDSVLAERALLPAKELRLRGIEQSTGESAMEEHPRRAISLTRDFEEAWAYHRHSPAYLGDFPVVYGISRSIAGRAYPAGMLEPGEILIDKVRVGNSILTRFGLREPELTHVFVPDPKVASVRNMLRARRVAGVNVIGLGELKAPEWNLSAADPPPEY